MVRFRSLWMVALTAVMGIPSLGQASEDPVLLARSQRASARGISENDLPPVPRSIVEPPPLPPPELHPRDQRGSRAARAARKGGRSSKASTAKKRKAPAKNRSKRTR